MCLACVYTGVWIFHQMRNELSAPTPAPLPHINYIRPVIYGQITGCKTHYFLMETGPWRDPSASIMVGPGLTASYERTAYLSQSEGGICPPAHHLNTHGPHWKSALGFTSPAQHLVLNKMHYIYISI